MKEQEYWPPDRITVQHAQIQVKQTTLNMKLPFSPSKPSPAVIDPRDYPGRIEIRQVDPLQALKFAQNTAA